MRQLELMGPCDFTPEDGSPTQQPHVLLCRGCGHTVRDLSAMNEADALAFLDRRRPEECVQFRTDAHHRVRFADGTGSLLGRLARDAKPMIAVATLALAACGEGQTMAPNHPSSSPIVAPPAEQKVPPLAESSAAATAAPPEPAAPPSAVASDAPSTDSDPPIPPFPASHPVPSAQKSITAPATPPSVVSPPDEFRLAGR